MRMQMQPLSAWRNLMQANLVKMKAELDATASINKLAEAAKSAAIGLGGMTIGGVPAAQFMSTAIALKV
jgi:orotate phosphoribosyltransferase